MKVCDPFRSLEVTRPLLAEIAKQTQRPIRLMEVCGTHTMSLFRHGIRSLLPASITLLSGPGCPVCVTPAADIDTFISAARVPGVILATFGDLIRVPGSLGSLAEARAGGAQVEIVYSPIDALTLAEKHPENEVVFPAIGFETTAPTIAATILEAHRRGLSNFSVIPACKTMPEALSLLLGDPALQVDGLLCPGHVSAVIGADTYLPLAERHGLACAVAGFEPADILAGILSLVTQIKQHEPRVDNCYTRVVTNEGNRRAQALLAEVFAPVDSEWRGLGMIPASGLCLRAEYQQYSALARLGLKSEASQDPKGCRCGEVLKGMMQPPTCPLYGTACTPLHPIGPCMVSTEGTCAAYYKYSGIRTSRDTRTASLAHPTY